MPYFHSAINVFKWLLLSSGFDIHSENVSLKIEKTKQKSRHRFFFFFSFLCQFRPGQWNEIQKWSRTTRVKTAAAPHSFMSGPAFLLLPSGWQQRAGSPNRRLPLSDYNLWSISIIGGVCRDSYSNNYLDWSVSKATNIHPPPPQPPTPLHRERQCVCVCVHCLT